MGSMLPYIAAHMSEISLDFNQKKMASIGADTFASKVGRHTNRFTSGFVVIAC
jgi:hypothetical protein